MTEIVGGELAAVQVLLQLLAKRRTGCHLAAQEIAGSDVLDPESHRDASPLGALPRSGRSDQQDVHGVSPGARVAHEFQRVDLGSSMRTR
jgi:hypothetical protein